MLCDVYTFVSTCCAIVYLSFFFFLMLRRPPRSTLFPTRRSSDLAPGRGDRGTLRQARRSGEQCRLRRSAAGRRDRPRRRSADRKSTRLNSSHSSISYAVFCLKKKKKIHNTSLIHTYHLEHTGSYP